MEDKSYVTMERKVCIVCGKEYETNALLLDKHLRNKFDKHTTTGFGMCEEHKKLEEDGYIALVECDESKSKVDENGTIKPENAYRTGRIAHLKKEKAMEIFNQELPSVVFADIELLKRFSGE
jgi:hypothetical protein